MLCYAQFLLLRTTVRICRQPSVRNDNLVTESHSLQSSEFHFSYFVPTTRKEYFFSEYERYIYRRNFLIRRPFPRHSWNNFKALKNTYDEITQWSKALWITSHKNLGNLWYQNVSCRFSQELTIFSYSVSRNSSLYFLQNCFFKIRYIVRGYCIQYWFFVIGMIGQNF